jgi:hypothetical protein
MAIWLTLFCSLLCWSVVIYKTSRARDGLNAEIAIGNGTEATPVAKMSRTLAALVIGTLVWGGITFYLHAIVVGVSPLG